MWCQSGMRGRQGWLWQTIVPNQEVGFLSLAGMEGRADQRVAHKREQILPGQAQGLDFTQGLS